MLLYNLIVCVQNWITDYTTVCIHLELKRQHTKYPFCNVSPCHGIQLRLFGLKTTQVNVQKCGLYAYISVGALHLSLITVIRILQISDFPCLRMADVVVLSILSAMQIVSCRYVVFSEVKCSCRQAATHAGFTQEQSHTLRQTHTAFTAI